jgi:opacity protein-like surface antigen
MKRGIVLAAVAAMILAGFAPAEAAVIKKWSVETSVEGGYLKPDDGTGWEDTAITGARIGLSILPAFQVEASFNTFSANPNDPDAPNTDATTDYTGLRFIGSFLAQEDVKVLPYIAAGVGIVDSEIEPEDGGETESDDATYGELDFGARIFVWRNLNVRTEVGFRHSRTLKTTQTNVHLAVSASIFFGGVE